MRNVGALCKMVFWMRHGAGIHNDAEAALGTQRWEESEAKKDVYFDPELSAAGRCMRPCMCMCVCIMCMCMCMRSDVTLARVNRCL